MIRFACPQCHTGFQADDRAAGKKTKCPKCGAALSVPGPDRPDAPNPDTPLPTPKALAAARDDEYRVAAEPATGNQQGDFWNTLGSSPSDPLACAPSRVAPMRSYTSRSARNSRTKGLSMVSLGIGALVLVGIAVAATLWATGRMPTLHFAESPDAQTPMEKVQDQQQSDDAKANLVMFDPVRRAVTELRAAQDVGMNRGKFQTLLQQFSTELIVASEKARSPAEKRIADAYRQVLQVYKDSGKIWDVKISIPDLKYNADKYFDFIAGVADTDELDRYGDFSQAVIRGIPLDVYPEGTTGLDEIVARYSIPVQKEKGFRIIAESSIQLLWQRAAEEMDDVNKLRTNG